MSSRITLLKEKINHAVLWALFESCGYKLLYLILHILFFKKLSPNIYTLQASVFSIIYMGVTFFNRGFDQSLLYHFNKFAFSCKGLKELAKISLQHFIVTSILLTFTAFIFFHTPLLSFIQTTHTSFFILILGLLLLIEMTKKNIKVMLYLTFYNTAVTIAELIGLACYTYIITSTLSYDTSTITHFFSYLLCVNSIVVLAFLGCLYHYYRHIIPEDSSPLLTYNTGIQYQSYFLQITKLLLSSQLLMPLYAFSAKLNESAHFFLIATLIQSGEFILYKVCYISGSTFFVYDTDQSTFLSNHMLSILLKRLVPFYVVVAMIAWIPLFYLLPHTTTNLYFTFLYGATLLIDNFLLLYEKYAIIHNKVLKYSMYTFILCATAWSTLYITKTTHLFFSVSLFFIGKLLLLIFVYTNEKRVMQKQGAD